MFHERKQPSKPLVTTTKKKSLKKFVIKSKRAWPLQIDGYHAKQRRVDCPQNLDLSIAHPHAS